MLQPPAVHAAVVHGDSGSVAVWNEGDSTWVYVVGPRGNAVIPQVTDSALRAVGIAPDGAKPLRNPPLLSYGHIDAYFDFQVERQAHDLPKGPQPKYPDALRSAGVEGNVTAQFIIDSAGQPVVGSFKALKSSHWLFTLAIFSALPDYRFEPAQVKGHPVAELVQFSFGFGRRIDPVKIGGQGGSATVSFARDTSWLSLETTSGTFVVHTDSFMMAQWADTAAHARPPSPHGATKSDYTDIEVSYTEPTLHATVAMGILRLTADSASPFQITGANGSWKGTLVMPFDSAQRLFAAMRGPPATMRVWRTGPALDLAPQNMGFQVVQQASPRPGNPLPYYPKKLQSRLMKGTVVAQFVVDSTGAVEAPTIQILHSTDPLFALAVYVTLPQWRYNPALINGRHASETVQQPFAFNMR
jgi:TonB family protein